MLARTASRFLFDERGRKQLETDDWETIYPSAPSAARALKTYVARKHLQVTETKKQLLARKKAPKHWSDLAPHSATSVLASQIEHLVQLEMLLTRVVNMCRELGDERNVSTASGGVSSPLGGDEPSALTSTSALSQHNLSEGYNNTAGTTSSGFKDSSAMFSNSSALSLSNIMLSMFATSPTLVALLRQVVATEEDLQRREAFSRLADWQQGDTLLMDSSAMAASMRNFSPLRQGRAAKQQAALQLFVRDVTDATSFIGRRMCAIRGAVDAWLWEGFDGEAIAERLSNFVDEIVSDVRNFDQQLTDEEAAEHRRSVAGGSLESLEGLPDEVLIAAVEDELYCYDGMYKVLRESLKVTEDDAVLNAQIIHLRGATQGSLHVPELFQYRAPADIGVSAASVVPYAKSIAALKMIQLYRTPTRKLLVIKAASKQLLEEMKTAAIANGAKEEKLIVGGDDFIPMFVYITVKSGLPDLASEVLYLRHCMPRSLRHGELGYYSTTLEFACEFIKNIASAAHTTTTTQQQPSTQSPMLQSMTSTTAGDLLNGSQLECGSRPAYLALPDAILAHRWVSTRVVSFYNNRVEDASDSVLCGGLAVNEAMLTRRHRLLAVACVSSAPSDSSFASTGEESSDAAAPTSPSGDFVHGGCRVQVLLVDISSLSSTQWSFVTESLASQGSLVVLREALTSTKGLRVLVPVAVVPAERSNPNTTWTVPATSPKEVRDTFQWIEAYTEQLRIRRFSETLNPIQVALAQLGDNKWPILAPPALLAASNTNNTLVIVRVQQMLALFWALAPSDVDGCCCEETILGVEALQKQFHPALPQQQREKGPSPHQQQQQHVPLDQLFLSLHRTLEGAIRELQQKNLLPPAAVSTTAVVGVSLEDVMQAVRAFQLSQSSIMHGGGSSLIASGKLTGSTLARLLAK